MKRLLQKRIFLFDLDGTLYLGAKVLPGARALISLLRQRKVRIFFFTNNSSRSLQDYVLKLKEMGFHPQRDEIVMSTQILIRYLLQKKWRRIFLLGTPKMQRMLQQAGIRNEMKKRPQVIVVGFDKTLTYSKLLHASRWIDRGVPYIVTHPDYFCPTDQGPEPDCGAIAKLLQLATKRSPLVTLGKPHPMMIEEVIRRLGRGAKRSQMLMVGDRLHTDILMAKSAKIQSVLVLTGDTKRAELKRGTLKPTQVLPSAKALLEVLKNR